MTIITTAIGLILVYLILSLVVTAIQEAIASWFSLRGKHLCHAIDQMLTNECSTEQGVEMDTSLLEKFMDHTCYRELIFDQIKPGEKAHKHPSYMSASTFSDILFHVLDGTDIKKLEAAIQDMRDGRLKEYLLETLQAANNDLTHFQQSVERWYDRVMSRASGWYKRYIQKIILAVGLLLAGYMNADTLSIYTKMSQVTAGSPQEQAINALAQNFVDNRYDNFQQQITSLQQEVDSTAAQINVAQVLAQNQRLLSQVDTLLTGATGPQSPLGLGWTKAEWTALKTGGIGSVFNKLIGLLITTFAISLGAPFWFDMLRKIINIRNAGPVHETSQEKQ